MGDRRKDKGNGMVSDNSHKQKNLGDDLAASTPENIEGENVSDQQDDRTGKKTDGNETTNIDILESFNSQERNKREQDTPSPSSKGKKLTLQERLALAARGKKKNSHGSTTPFSPSTSPSSESLSMENNRKKDPISGNSFSPKTLTGQEADELQNKLELSERKNKELSDHLNRLQMEVSKDAESKDLNKLTEQLSSKDETISQLMKEGEALSMKELKLNDTIKKLKGLNSDLESSLHDYVFKCEDAEKLSKELDNLLKRNDFKSVGNLMEALASMRSQITKFQEDEKERKTLDKKYKDLHLSYNNLTTENERLSKALNESNIKLGMLERQNLLEIESKDKEVKDLQSELISLKEENVKEVDHLESKIEELRLGNERALTLEDTHESENSRKVDFEDYAALNESHRTLQQQYLYLQKNYSDKEICFTNKIEKLCAHSESLKEFKDTLYHEFEVSQRKLKDFENEEEMSKARLRANEDEIRNLQLAIEERNTEINALKINIERLEEQIHLLRENLTTEKNKDSGQFERHNLLNPIPILNDKNFSEDNILPESPKNLNDESFGEVKFGESSTTPVISRQLSAQFFTNSLAPNLESRTSLSSNINSNEAENDEGTGSRNLYSRRRNLSTLVDYDKGYDNNNIQLVSRMGSNVRRQELELYSLKEENNKLLSEKEQINRELAYYIRQSEIMDDLCKEIEDLKHQIADRISKEQTLLEIIGEKTERASELQADVEDLKELCRTQVQQIVELHEKL